MATLRFKLNSAFHGRERFRSSSSSTEKVTTAKKIKRPSSSHHVNFSKDLGNLRKTKGRCSHSHSKATCVITAHMNGSKTGSARVIGSSMNELLNECTVKLHLLTSARRLFNGDGSEIFNLQSIIDYDQVYVSVGEPFINPNAAARRYIESVRNVSWTMNGLVWHEKKPETASTRISTRMKRLLAEPKKRILIFKNGFYSDSVEVVARSDDINEVIEVGTKKLKLTSKGKLLFDWLGQTIVDLNEAPVMDPCLQTWKSSVIGPLWLSCGEGFSPKGAYSFLIGITKYIREQLKSVTGYKHQVSLALSGEEGSLIQTSSLLSMSDSELKVELEKAGDYGDGLQNAFNRLNILVKSLKKSVSMEESEGSLYKWKHIKEINVCSRLLGDNGLRLKVFRNGSLRHSDAFTVHFNIHQAKKSIDPNLPPGPQLLELLIRRCSDAANLNPGSNIVGRMLFNEEGARLDDIKQLAYDQKVWLSCGEPWKFQDQVLEVKFYSVKVGSLPPKEDGATNELTLVKGSSGSHSSLINMRSQVWLPSSKFLDFMTGNPPDNVIQDKSVDEKPGDLERKKHINGNDHLSAPNMAARWLEKSHALHCEVGSSLKVNLSGPLQPEENVRRRLQSWIIDQEGFITSKFTRGLLTKTERTIQFVSKHTSRSERVNTEMCGFFVTIREKMSEIVEKESLLEVEPPKSKTFHDESDDRLIQRWNFTADGYIHPEGQESLVLTLVDKNVFYFHDSWADVSEEILLVAKRFVHKDQLKYQRWGVRQEHLHGHNQWRHTAVDNLSVWHKATLCWPVTCSGEFNESYDWPLKGFIVAFAPPTRKPESSLNTRKILKLFVLKNGDRRKEAAELIRVLQDGKKEIKKKGGAISAEQLNFYQFLDQCSTRLNLPSVARRVFDGTSKELFTLDDLSDGQFLYISMGEPWSNPVQLLCGSQPKEKNTVARKRQEEDPLVTEVIQKFSQSPHLEEQEPHLNHCKTAHV